MDYFFKSKDALETARRLLKTVNLSTDDFLFVWDITSDQRWFFGDIDKRYNIRKSGNGMNNTSEMMEIIHPADRDAVLKSLEELAKGEKDAHCMDYRWINKEGKKVWINCHGILVRDENEKPYLMFGRVSEENLRHLYNPVTGLWNHDKLRQDMERYLEDNVGYLMLLDVDDLTTTNLTYGREYGDQLLQEIAEFCESLENVSMVYHVDQNCFGLVLHLSSESEVRGVYEHIKKSMRSKCTFTASAVPINNDVFYNGAQLLDSVKMTLEKVKERSNNRIGFFSQEDLCRSIVSLELLAELKESIENGFVGFEVVYQPQLRAGTYDVFGAEALLRYRSSVRGNVYPDEFIPLLEQSRLIKKTGMWVLERALAQCKIWRRYCPNFHISVNFSPIQFEDTRLAEHIRKRLKAFGLSGDVLTVEVTESIGLFDNLKVKNTVKYLKRFQINVSIDDFGTGYSNLGYLKLIKADEIKIDRSFIKGLKKGTYNYKLIGNVIEFAKENQIRVCCEGVETPRELAVLESKFPDLIQGYLFCKPVSVSEIEKMINPLHDAFFEWQKYLFRVKKQKEKVSIIHFDPKDILRNSGLGLWRLVQNANGDFDLYMDENMEILFSIPENLSPSQRNIYCFSHLADDAKNELNSFLSEMKNTSGVVQWEYRWSHPELGDLWILTCGKRAEDWNGMTVFEGYSQKSFDRFRKENVNEIHQE